MCMCVVCVVYGTNSAQPCKHRARMPTHTPAKPRVLKLALSLCLFATHPYTWYFFCVQPTAPTPCNTRGSRCCRQARKNCFGSSHLPSNCTRLATATTTHGLATAAVTQNCTAIVLHRGRTKNAHTGCRNAWHHDHEYVKFARGSVRLCRTVGNDSCRMQSVLATSAMWL